jgi:SAM-dependent methyltransferase
MKVLDMGCGKVPDYRATHGADLCYDKKMQNSDEKWVALQAKELGVPKDEIARRRSFARRVDITEGVDFNKALPYPNKTFDVVVSHSSVAAFGRRKAYSEAFRVLKPGGQVEIGAARLPKAWVEKVTNHMEKTGFQDMVVKKGLQDTRAMIRDVPQYRKDIVIGEKP